MHDLNNFLGSAEYNTHVAGAA